MKYCTNCGKELKAHADICVKCGVMLNKLTVSNNKNTHVKKGFGITSMILGIIVVLIGLGGIAIISDPWYNLFATPTIKDAILFVMVDLVFIGIALPFAIIERKNNRNGFNTAGLILSIVASSLVFVQLLMYLT